MLPICLFIDKPQLYFRRSAFLPVDREEQLIEQERPQVVISLLYHEVIEMYFNPLAYSNILYSTFIGFLLYIIIICRYNIGCL